MLMDSDVLTDSDEEGAVIDRLVAQHAAAAASAARGDRPDASSGVASRSASATGAAAHASALPHHTTA